jgi:hypothetical protein
MDLVDFVAVKQDAFRQGCFSRVNMCADPDIPHLRNFDAHLCLYLSQEIWVRHGICGRIKQSCGDILSALTIPFYSGTGLDFSGFLSGRLPVDAIY